MENKEFWRLIEKSREFNQAEWLTEELAQKGLEQREFQYENNKC